MAKYFRYFPKTFYSTSDDSAGLDSVTNIISRFSIAEGLIDNTNIFYPYDVQDTDTPEIIAHKIYGGVEKHWIVLAINQIVDPQWDWPLKHDTLIEYVNQKYTANANTGQTGIAWAQDENNIKNYYKVVTRTITDNSSNRQTRGRTQDIQKFKIDANTYANVAAETTFDDVLNNGTSITETVSKETESYYTYEFNENEAKRSIKILKPELVSELDKEFKRVFTR